MIEPTRNEEFPERHPRANLAAWHDALAEAGVSTEKRQAATNYLFGYIASEVPVEAFDRAMTLALRYVR